MKIILIFISILLIALSLALAYKNKLNIKNIANITILGFLFIFSLASFKIFAAKNFKKSHDLIKTIDQNGSNALNEEANNLEKNPVSIGKSIAFAAAALTTACACLGAGIAVSSTAPAAIGALSENPKTFMKALLIVGLAETIAVYGILISFMILQKL